MEERFFAAINGAMGPNHLRVHTSPGTTGILLRCVLLVFLVIRPLISAGRGRQLLIMSTLTGYMKGATRTNFSQLLPYQGGEQGEYEQLYHNLVTALDEMFDWVENLVSLCAFL